jgi:DNA-binding transcriptional ArsR family regulator
MISSADSNLEPPSRHVALALSLYMSERGDSAWPSVARLAADTGLSLRTVQTHLGKLTEAGWLTSTPRHKADGSRTSNLYTATVPGDGGGAGAAGGLVQLTAVGGAGAAPKDDKRAPEKKLVRHFQGNDGARELKNVEKAFDSAVTALLPWMSSEARAKVRAEAVEIIREGAERNMAWADEQIPAALAAIADRLDTRAHRIGKGQSKPVKSPERFLRGVVDQVVGNWEHGLGWVGTESYVNKEGTLSPRVRLGSKP